MFEWLKAWGPIGPCLVLLLGGVLCLIGGIFNWRWLYPDNPSVRYYSPGCRRFLLLLIGAVLIVTGIAFYIFSDHLIWD